jgi:T-complex protein 1 subunit beta
MILAMDTDKIKIFGARIKVDSTGKLAELERAEREKMKAKVANIAAHGINCFVNRQLVYNYPENLLAEKGIMCIEHADFEGVERLSLVTGGEIASTFDHPEKVKLGHCNLIEEIVIGEDKVSNLFGPRFLNPYSFVADQILGCGDWRGMYRRPSWFNKPNG